MEITAQAEETDIVEEEVPLAELPEETEETEIPSVEETPAEEPVASSETSDPEPVEPVVNTSVAPAAIPAVADPVVPTTPVVNDPIPTGIPELEPIPTAPVSPDPTTPVDPEPTTPVAPRPTRPVNPQPTTPVDPEPTTPVDPEPTMPIDPEPTPGLTDAQKSLIGFQWLMDQLYNSAKLTAETKEDTDVNVKDGQKFESIVYEYWHGGNMLSAEGKTLDSTGVNYGQYINQQLLAANVGLTDTDVFSWAITVESRPADKAPGSGGGYDFTLYWSNENISDYSAGEKVAADRYQTSQNLLDPETGKEIADPSKIEEGTVVIKEKEMTEEGTGDKVSYKYMDLPSWEETPEPSNP